MDVHATLPLFAGPFLLLALWKHSLGRHTDLTLRSARGRRGAYRDAAARARPGQADMKRALLAVVLLAACAGAAGWWWLNRASGPRSLAGLRRSRIRPRVADAHRTHHRHRRRPRRSGGGRRAAVHPGRCGRQGGARRRCRQAGGGARRGSPTCRRASRDTEIAQAEADLADLIATRDRIAKDLTRNEELLRTGAASRQTVDQQRADLCIGDRAGRCRQREARADALADRAAVRDRRAERHGRAGARRHWRRPSGS